MGTRRTEAFIKCENWQLENTDHVLMMTICHKWNDHQTRSLDISFSDLLGLMPYRGKKHANRTLVRSLKRLIDLQILVIEHNGRRYLQDRWLHIDIIWQEFWDLFDALKTKSKEKSVQPQLLESRAFNARPESTRVERASEGYEIPSDNGTRVERASEGYEIPSHSSTKDLKDLRSTKDHKKAAELRGVYSSVWTDEQEMNGQPPEAPRQVLIPAAALEDPAAAEAVYNTLTLPDAPDPSLQEADMDEATAARVAELQERADQLQVQLNDHSIVDPEKWRHTQNEYLAIRHQCDRLQTLLSDEEWHHRAATAARTRSERLVDILADLVHQRWPDFPYRIDWPQRLEQMVEAYRAAGRRGRDLLQDTLTASAASDKDNALILLTARWLEPKEDKPNDDRPPPQALHEMPADQEPDRIQRRQEHLRRPQAGLQAVLQRPAADKQAVPPEARQETASQPASPPVPALLETQMAEPVLSPHQPSGQPEPAVQSVS